VKVFEASRNHTRLNFNSGGGKPKKAPGKENRAASSAERQQKLVVEVSRPH